MTTDWISSLYAVPMLVLLAGGPAHAQRPAEQVLFDLNLTQGPTATKKRGVRVEGGAWDGGWRVTKDKDQRIVLDAGYPIRNGYLEADVTVSQPPYCPKVKCPDWVKVNFLGLHEDARLVQESHDGDIFYVRTGSEGFKFFNTKASGYRFDTSECEMRTGSTEDWVADDKTVHRFRLEWKDGVAQVHDYKGRTTTCATDRSATHPKPPRGSPRGANRPLAVDELRYAFLGSDHYTGLSPVGMRFLRVKLVDYDGARRKR